MKRSGPSRGRRSSCLQSWAGCCRTFRGTRQFRMARGNRRRRCPTALCRRGRSSSGRTWKRRCASNGRKPHPRPANLPARQANDADRNPSRGWSRASAGWSRAIRNQMRNAGPTATAPRIPPSRGSLRIPSFPASRGVPAPYLRATRNKGVPRRRRNSRIAASSTGLRRAIRRGTLIVLEHLRSPDLRPRMFHRQTSPPRRPRSKRHRLRGRLATRGRSSARR